MGAWLGEGRCALSLSVVEWLGLWLRMEDAVEEESLSGTILSEVSEVWRATKSAQERESLDERLRFLRTIRSRTRCPTRKRGEG